MQSENVKIVVFVPEADADRVRVAMGVAGAGKMGNYTHCSFSTKGIGRFLPGDGAHPAIGAVGKLESVAEERIEFLCEKSTMEAVITAMKSAHPYEEVAYDIYPLLVPTEEATLGDLRAIHTADKEIVKGKYVGLDTLG